MNTIPQGNRQLMDICEIRALENTLADPNVAMNEYPNPPWNTVSYDWNTEYPEASPEWFAQKAAKFALATGLQYNTTPDKYGRPGVAQESASPGTPAPDKAGARRIAVIDDSYAYVLKDGKPTRYRYPTPAHIGDLFDLCDRLGVQTIWVLAGTHISDRATSAFIGDSHAGDRWKVYHPVYTSGHEQDDTIARCTFVSGYPKSDPSSYVRSIGYAEHANEWGFEDITVALHLLLAITYLEDAIGEAILYSPMSTSKRVMFTTNRGKRDGWLRGVNVPDFPELAIAKVIDISWKRPLYEHEQSACTLFAGDKNSMYTAACTSALMGEGSPRLVRDREVSAKSVPTGLFYVTFSGTSSFDGRALPHPLQGLLYGNIDQLVRDPKLTHLPLLEKRATLETGETEALLWTYSVKLLCELGYRVRVHACYIWDQTHTTLRPWAEKLWTGRASLDSRNPACNKERYSHEIARKIAYNAVKPIMNRGLGLLDSSPRFKENTSSLYRPDFYNLLKDAARYYMYWRIRKVAQETGYTPIGVHTDCLLYMLPQGNIIPGFFDRADKLGGYKQSYTQAIRSNQIAWAFADESLPMTQASRIIAAIEKGD